MPYYFKPRWWSTLTTLFFLGAFIALGFWQIDRYHQKINLQQQYAKRPVATPLTLHDIKNNSKDLRYYAINLSGSFDNQLNFLLDNQFFRNQIGYHVFTLFLPDNDKQGVLIDRGWIPLGQDREHLPVIKPAVGHLQIQGMINIPQHAVILSNKYKIENQGTWPLRVEAIDTALFSSIIKQPVYPFVVLLKSGQAGAFVCEWNPIHTEPQRHLGYAVQWFTFAVVLLIIYVALNSTRKE